MTLFANTSAACRYGGSLNPEVASLNALNRAIDIARKDYIVWIDDDVLVDPGLLTAYAAAFQRWPEAAVFGGRIKPKYEAPVEKWVLESEAVLGGPYAIRDFGDPSPAIFCRRRGPFPLWSELGHSCDRAAGFSVRSQSRPCTE
jgi:glycosyltransferase involved in cell wall biosynthesis